MASAHNLSTSLEALLSSAVKRGVAPGLSAIAFDRAGTFAEAATGVADVSTQAPVTLDTVVWFASTSKLAVSLLTLIAAERFDFDIDSHEQLVKLVPELGKDWKGTKAWTLFDGTDEKGEWKYKPAKPTDGLTVRHLLSHTSGYGYFFSDEENAWLMQNVEGGADLGSMAYLNAPRLIEAGKEWHYNMGCDWLAVIIPRLTSLTLRDAFQQYLFTPLGIAPDTLDSFRTAAMDAHRGAIAMRDPSSHAFGPLPMPFDTPQYEGVPPEGKNPLTSAPLWGTLPAFTTILQSLLAEEGPKDKEGRPLLSETMWAEARKDALEYIGAEVLQRPVTKTVMPHTAMEVDWWKKPKQIKEGSRHPVGWSLLQATVLKEESETGLLPGTITWSGLANTYYFIDRTQGIGAIVTTQYLPWGTPEMLDLRDEVERWTVANNPRRA